MKVFLKYEDNEDADLHKTLKITLPKSWKQGPTSKLLNQFVESYNASPLGSQNTLLAEEMHLEMRVSDGNGKSSLEHVATDAISIQVIPDRADVYVMHGPSKMLSDMQEQEQVLKKETDALVNCTHFGCKKRFPKGEAPTDTPCIYHRLPPVFHETAKYWACCPDKKAYDWNDFESIPGCQTGSCTEVKEENQKQFLGGSDLREQNAGGPKLRSIDDFNKAQAAGGTDAAPVLQRLKSVFADLDIEAELFDQVVDGMKNELGGDQPEVLGEVAKQLGSKLKATMKAIAAEQLRIK